MKPREILIESPYKNEVTVCKCGAPLIRHILPLGGRVGGCAVVDQQFDPEIGRWVETRLVFDTSEYKYSCSWCHIAADLCECNESDISRDETWEDDRRD
jgi:hypothetical protein